MKNVVENKFRKITYRESLIKLQHIENCLHKKNAVGNNIKKITHREVGFKKTCRDSKSN